MKKLFLAFAMVAGTASFAQAQVQIGPKIGLNVSSLNMDIEEDSYGNFQTSPTLGYNFGVAANIGISQMFSFAPELIFTQRGGKYSGSVSENLQEGGDSFSYSFSTEATFNMTFVEMPLLLRASFGSSSLKGYVNAGPSIGYWLGGTYAVSERESYSITMDGESFSGNESYNERGKIRFVDEYNNNTDDLEFLKEDARRLALGASFGGGIMLPLGGSNLLIDARYTHATGDLLKLDREEEGPGKFRTSGFSLSAIFLFGK